MATSAEMLKRYVEKQGIRQSRIRQEILDIFNQVKGHLTIAELSQRVRQKNPRIGMATIYRSMRLFCDAGLAAELDLGDGTKRYEAKQGSVHHDHLICLRCGKIIEAVDQEIEALQVKMARNYQFKIISHSLQLFGWCKTCQQRDGVKG